MPLSVSIKADTLATRRMYQGVQKQLPYATSVALNKTAESAQKEIVAEMPRVFAGPTPYTLRSTFVKRSSKNQAPLAAWVGFKGVGIVAGVGITTQEGGRTPSAIYLAPEAYSGKRIHKAFENILIRAGIMNNDEYAVPGREVKLDKYGNIPPGQFRTMLSQLGLLTSQASRSKAKTKFFYRPKFRGIFMRLSKDRIAVFLKFVRQPNYKVRLRFERIVGDVSGIRFPIEFKRALDDAMETAKP